MGALRAPLHLTCRVSSRRSPRSFRPVAVGPSPRAVGPRWSRPRSHFRRSRRHQTSPRLPPTTRFPASPTRRGRSRPRLPRLLSLPVPPAAVAPRDLVSIAGRDYDRAQLEAWAQFDSIVGTDADLRNLIQEHLQRRSQGQQPASLPYTDDPLSPTGLPHLPELPPHYADDETIRGLYDVVRAQQDILDRTVRESRQALNTASSQAQRTYVDILTSACCPNSVSALGRSLDVCVGAWDPIGRQVFSSTYNWPSLAAGLRIRSAIFKLLQGSRPCSEN